MRRHQGRSGAAFARAYVMDGLDSCAPADGEIFPPQIGDDGLLAGTRMSG